MKETIKVELKESRLDEDMIIYFRILHASDKDSLTNVRQHPISLQNEIATLNSILNVCTQEQSKFKTTYEEDCAIYKDCKDYKMIQVLHYRMSKKKILINQCKMLKEILKSLEDRTKLPAYDAPFMIHYIESLFQYC